MIDRQKLEKIVNVIDSLTGLGLRTSCDIKSDSGIWYFWVYCERGMEETLRRKMIALCTTLVGRMEVTGESWTGEGNGISVYANNAQACKILGYKKVTKMVKEEIAREPQYLEVEKEVDVPITDCDIKSGKFTEKDIEVRA